MRRKVVRLSVIDPRHGEWMRWALEYAWTSRRISRASLGRLSARWYVLPSLSRLLRLPARGRSLALLGAVAVSLAGLQVQPSLERQRGHGIADDAAGV